jgi:hypothetical protein
MRTHAQLLAVLGLATSMAVLGSVPALTQSSPGANSRAGDHRRPWLAHGHRHD